MTKAVIFVLFAFCSTILANPLWPFYYEHDGIEHTYSIGLEIGEMNSQVGPFRLSVSLLKDISIGAVSDSNHLLNESMIFAGSASHNFTIKSDMPFSQVTQMSFEWESMDSSYAKDVNFQTAYLTETTPNQTHITKKYCNIENAYPQNWGSKGASQWLYRCE
ncbi:uncharacterized protein LOC107370434 [Tetranychus urticae]|uniref:Vitellogenin domain-containing protein n=1 Tax=Tetranychus urticae TaxID=32264 RepID=T1L5H8_TETUR|nr:uncharacterized protein LOC107370434 [Tetranychus urticae]